jgi:RNA polymerase sigma factor (sigma-70 family)
LQTGRPSAAPLSPGVVAMQQLYCDHVEVVRRAAEHACRHHGLGPEDIEDFTQHVHAKIIDDDYAVLRKWRREGRIEAFLAAVVARAFCDYINARWGKWRLSRKAQGLGDLAVRLETLLVRDRLTLQDACQTILTEDRGLTTESELHRIAEELPPRVPRRRDVSLDTDGEALRGGGAPRQGDVRLFPEPVSQERADDRVERQERAHRYEAAVAALETALRGLPDQDAVIARMLCQFTRVEIARRLNLEAKPLYRQVDRILKQLRQAMEAAGICAEDVADLLDRIPDS